ncbi:carbon-nitrogen hydrolase family protein [Actinoplanes sp. KI2]|uniref:carbon-nitrogen hydrolase family protein n=1 Tax=Actinoplanes sp. KI2 TaxID=2983315 RepID=UPI0021D5BD43|nr:carbon-nitrogen hydrolase family protein [Actinoplanes sp. KI2]MCU7724803.1 carbon-nitrogen hydrolase family protein [Actinoplanes sp. KI2]
MLRAGACQTPELLSDVPAALAVVESFADQAPGVDLLLFPECFLQGYLTTGDHLARTAYELGSPEFGEILARLAPLRQTLVLGLIERDGSRFFNSAVVITRGEVTGVYRKTHLTPGEQTFTAGAAYPVFDLNGVRFGINICYDTRFPAAAKAVAAQGAQVLFVPSQNMMGRAKAELWQPRHNAIRGERARETGMWLISADVTGERGAGRIGLGPTSVIRPDGVVVAQVPLHTVGMVKAEVGGRARGPCRTESRA